ncbi:hypothetical protein [Parapedobacter luteus]|uniref:hypothetical protein n=1 Tax=Parapedobacter luteus TaxID=623280 RepID=UPI001116F858|nr:hypothetical protein [Parapedobacter luteus]
MHPQDQVCFRVSWGIATVCPRYLQMPVESHTIARHVFMTPLPFSCHHPCTMRSGSGMYLGKSRIRSAYAPDPPRITAKQWPEKGRRKAAEKGSDRLVRKKKNNKKYIPYVRRWFKKAIA